MNERSGVKVLLAAAAILWAAAAQAAPRYTIHFKIGHPNLDYFEQAAKAFKTSVEAGSKGDIAVSVETAQNPWEDTGRAPGAEVAKLVASGEAEMGHSFTDTMGSMDHRLWAFDAPFLFRDYAHLEKVFEGPLGSEMLNGLREHDLVGLAFTYSGGANMVSTIDRPVRRLEDLKGLKVAVFGDPVDQAWLKSLGAQPVPFAHREDNIPWLTQTKAIDAAAITWRRHYRVARHAAHIHYPEAYRYGSLEGATYLVSVTYVNQKFFDSLPAEYRKLISDATREASRIERRQTIELNEACKRRLVSRGMQSVALEEKERVRLEQALAPVYERTIEPLVGKELIRRLRKAGLEGVAAR